MSHISRYGFQTSQAGVGIPESNEPQELSTYICTCPIYICCWILWISIFAVWVTIKKSQLFPIPGVSIKLWIYSSHRCHAGRCANIGLRSPGCTAVQAHCDTQSYLMDNFCRESWHHGLREVRELCNDLAESDKLPRFRELPTENYPCCGWRCRSRQLTCSPAHHLSMYTT